ncbi:acylphosphatase [Desulfolithobacter dissulfuricans]|nr:acylphosphatase [Desulfolithobacter dissulfuricans]
MMAEKRIHARVHGRVQGVFFRDHTRQKALELGLEGWVRNVADGTVEVMFQGDEDKVGQMLDWLHVGSPLSMVSAVEFEETAPVPGELGGFHIRY